MKRIENTGVCLAECPKDGTILAIVSPGPKSGGEPNLKRGRLYMVTMTLRRFADDGFEMYPITSIQYCIAPDGDEAIAQVNCAFWPNLGYFPESERENFSAVATLLPLRIRGWGNVIF